MTAINSYQYQGSTTNNTYGSIYGGQPSTSSGSPDTMGGYFSPGPSANMQYLNNVVTPNVDAAQRAYDYATGHSSDSGYNPGTSGTSGFRDYVNGVTDDANNTYHNAGGTSSNSETSSSSASQGSSSRSGTDSFRDYVNSVSSGVSQTYHQFDTLRANRNALEHLTANDDALLKKLDRAAGIGGRDHKVSKKDFKAALNSNDFTEEEKRTIRYLLDEHPALWDSLAGSDGKATFDEVHDALTGKGVDLFS